MKPKRIHTDYLPDVIIVGQFREYETTRRGAGVGPKMLCC